MQGKWDELPVIAVQIRDSVNAGNELYFKLIKGFRPYLLKCLGSIRYLEVSGKRFRSQPVLIDEAEFDQLCEEAVYYAIEKWDEIVPLKFAMKDGFRKAYRASVKLKERQILFKSQEQELDFLDFVHFIVPEHPADKMDNDQLQDILEREISEEEPECQKIMLERTYVKTSYKFIAMQLGLETRQCINKCKQNRERIRTRMSKRYPDFVSEYLTNLRERK